MLDGKVYLQISAPISEGSSGGVLLNKNGKAIGVTSSGYIEGQNLNFAIPVNDVISLFEQPENLMTLTECAEKETPDVFLTPEAVYTGKMFSTAESESDSTLYVNTYDNGIYLVYLKRQVDLSDLTNIKQNGIRKKDIIIFFVVGGDSFTINIPKGNYKIYYGYGTGWYGKQYKLGTGAVYYKAADEEISVDETHSLTLNLSADYSGSDFYEVGAIDFPYYDIDIHNY